jgi:hypothetical protein
MIIGPGSAAWEVIRDLVNHLPVMITPRWVRSRSTPIALDNLLTYLAEAPALDQTAGEIYDVGGPDVLDYASIMRRYGKLVGRRPLILPVPVLTPRLSSYWLRLVTSVPTDIARALIDGLSQDVIADDPRLAGLIPQDLLGFDATAQAALNADRQHAVTSRWVEGSIACRSFNPDYGYYARQESRSFETEASAADIWTVLCRIGVKGDFFAGYPLWWLRRVGDWLIGGPSMRRPRRHPDELRVGDVLDSWRVIGIAPERRLTLLMEMKAPGSGVLEFRVADLGHTRRITMTAYFHPAGAWGLTYWWVLLPAHGYLFNASVRSIANRALAEHADP